ncbi:hypothetical protein EMA8858_04174 [Emticicia aquatica]|uniref:HEPN domain-containing protein n=1 Tax=Emticicia aquatica TaxID=1681835 RepID=A0ABM9AW47_9BACT|nr:hypothetical protein [Emticicia aquatica]CAH0998039.1 hypothetical protein EMA8858_04174 [Emticicia aquatica]
MSNHKTLSIPIERGRLIISYYINAYQDYLGARALLLDGLLPQGIVLANTAIEKYLKGILTIVNVKTPRNHDISTKRYFNVLKNQFRTLHNSINWEFIAFLSKAYRIRYIDDLEGNFNIAIIRYKTLAELDFLVSQIEEKFEIGEATKQNKYEVDKRSQNPLLLTLNYFLTGLDKTTLIERTDKVFEFRLMENREILQTDYLTNEVKNDNKFLYEALKPSENLSKTQFSLCFQPVNN